MSSDPQPIPQSEVTDSLKRPITSSPLQPTSDSKRQKTSSDPIMEAKTRLRPANETLPAPVSTTGLEPSIPIMPPSLELVTGVKADLRASKGHIGQEEVGVIGYVGAGNAPVNGVIKQRFTDFLVNEVGMDGQVIHLKDITKPKEPKPEAVEKPKPTPTEAQSAESTTEDEEPLPQSLQFDDKPGWPQSTTRRLRPHFSDETIINLHALFVEGKEPPRKPDAGWGSRPVRPAAPVLTAEEEAMNVVEGSGADDAAAAGSAVVAAASTGGESSGGGGRGQGRDRGRGRGRNDRGGRGGRGGGGGGGGGGRGSVVKDDREVLSQVIMTKEGRTGCHTVIRELFRGLFDSGTKAEPKVEVAETKAEGETKVEAGAGGEGEKKAGGEGEKKAEGEGEAGTEVKGETAAEEKGGEDEESKMAGETTKEGDVKPKPVVESSGSRIVITFARAGVSRSNGWGNGASKPSTKHLPPYLHFTLQKTNRETQDALAYLARSIGCQSKDLGIAGTKDKRAVTVQRISLKRGHKTMETVWKACNGLKGAYGGGGERKAVKERADRGARVGDFCYKEEGLDLGLLRGNEFRITLRNVVGDSDDAINTTLASLRDYGFINFYGMQRFGTSSVPTHLTGLFILQSRWSEAVDSILSLRQNEHPDCIRGRLAWLDEGDIEKALKEMPRRCVAERSIWEFWKRMGGKSSDSLGALGTIPRNLRTMYVHAYQSYIWNLITSERIKLSSTSALPGDLVIVRDTSDVPDTDARPAVETSSSQTVKHLTEDDVGLYSIFDVVHPLPGFDVEYPKGRMGELYGELLRADGLDLNHMRRDQREYSLPGSYRPIINKPQSLKWSIVRYTDPNLPLVQSDEDRILGLNPPAPHDPEGMFRAVVLEMILGPAAYATMALREVTREETSSWWQTSLTVKGEDQGFRDGAGVGAGVEGEEEAGEGEGEGVEVEAEAGGEAAE